MVEQQNALAIRKPASIIHDYSDMERAAKAMATSGYFTDSRDFSQAVVKIMAGQEMGFGVFASMTGIYIIKGRPSIGANLMAAAVKGSGRYNYRVVEMTDKNCSIDFFENGEKIGNSSFSAEDAKKAGTQNMDKCPRNMLFARAISNGVKWFTPDVFNGSPVYTPEELGAAVNEDGQPINTTWKPADTLEETEPDDEGEAGTAAFDQEVNGKTQRSASPIAKPVIMPVINKPSQKMKDNWSGLFAQAKEYGLTVESLDMSTISAEELAEHGKKLRGRIDAIKIAIADNDPVNAEIIRDESAVSLF
jgi:hypothetical protein